MAFEVQEYRGGRDGEIADLILGIQNEEAGLALTIAEQPDLVNIAASYADGGFWIALEDDRIIGTIGLLDYSGRGVLKKFFVAKPHRGATGPAWPLFLALLAKARGRQLTDIVLDTPAIAERSHAFYVRAGFEPIALDDLPSGYEYPDRSSRLFQLNLSK